MSDGDFWGEVKDLSQATILIVDDQPINIELLKGILEDDYRIMTADSGLKALQCCQEMMPDLVILDVVMPELDGLQTCHILKADLNTSNIPIIFVTAVTEQHEENACWDAGGIDFLNKPVNPLTLHHRVKAQLTIKLQSDLLRAQAYMDGLTHIYNRRYFDDYYAKQQVHAKRSGEALCILLIDIDFFKQYNDHFGHLQGDICLKRVASILKATLCRPLDIVARYGGEEFVCILPATDIHGASVVAEKLLVAVQQLDMPHPASEHNVLTISIGVGCYKKAIENADTLMQLADKNLYMAKTAGRNRYYA